MANLNIGGGAVGAAIVGLAATAGVVYFFRQGGVNVDPFDGDNVIAKTADKVTQVITQDKHDTLGGRLHELIHGTYDPNAGNSIAGQLQDFR